MRPIKFRGKRLDNQEWAYGNYVAYKEDDGESVHCIVSRERGMVDASLDFVPVDPETVGQFTGLFDKDGKEIYEGDVVKWDDQSNGRYWRFAVVQLAHDIRFDCASIQQYAGITNSSDYAFSLGIFAYRDTHNWLETIDNIHDNPELLKTK